MFAANDQPRSADPTEPDQLDRRRGEPRVRMRTPDWSYELRGSEIADLCWRDTLLLRAIRPVVRDRDWNTTPPRITATTAGEGSVADGVVIEVLFQDETVAIAGRLQVGVLGDTMEVSFEATARDESWCNRVGLVVLHPPTVAGSPVVALHGVAGQEGEDREESRWPLDISPHQPYADLSGFDWTTPDGIAVRLRFAGDVFETEDQRNWTDASFKTYSTPLSRPFPVRYAPGATTTQSVTLTAVHSSDAVTGTRPTAGPVAEVVVGPDAGRMPSLGTMAALYPAPSSGLGLRPGVFDALLVELVADPDLWPALLTAAAAQAAELGCGLDLRVVTDRPERLAEVVRAAGTTSVDLLRLAAFDPSTHLTTPALWTALRRLELSPATQLVAGTRAHFTELNRNVAQLPADAPAVTFSITPQMHATELDHLVESLPMQYAVAANAHRLLPGRPLHVGPITLARRFNAVATTGPRSPEVDAADAVDPLQPTRFTAAWTLGSVAALSAAGVESLCYFEVAGPRGLTVDAEPTPAGQLLQDLAGTRGCTRRRTDATPDVAALAVRRPDGHTQVWLGDLSGRDRTVQVRCDDHTTAVELPTWDVVSLRL